MTRPAATTAPCSTTRRKARISSATLPTYDSSDLAEADDLDDEVDPPDAVALADARFTQLTLSCADPGAIHIAGPEFYTVCTGELARHRSSNLVHWTDDEDFNLLDLPEAG